MVEKHRTSRHRSWRKLHIVIDAGSGEIVAIELTEKDVDDAERTGALLDKITDPKDLGAAIKRAVAVVKKGEPALVDVVCQGR